MEYQACGEVCHGECYDSPEVAAVGCEVTCVEGCHCPPGFKLYHGECVDMVECVCLYNDEEVQAGFIVIENCQTW